MSPYIARVWMVVWDWLLGPPLHWAMSLSFEWKLEAAAVLLLLLFGRRLLIGVLVVREEAAVWWGEKRRVREWYCYGAMAERDFRAIVDALRKRADRDAFLAERLAFRVDGRRRAGPMYAAAARRQARADAGREEADRLEELWREIEAERSRQKPEPSARIKVMRLMRRLLATENGQAAGALAELNRISSSFEWLVLTPKSMPDGQKTRLVQLLRLMSSTTQLGEARNAYASAQRMMQQNGWARLWETL